MKESLKQKLNIYIKNQNGEVVSLDRVAELCRLWGYKTSTAERRLRPSDSPNIGEKWNDKQTAIIGYYWQESAPQRTIKPNLDFCCGSRLRGFAEHSKDCWQLSLKKLTIRSLF